MTNAIRVLALVALASTYGCSTPPAAPVNQHTVAPKPAVSVTVDVDGNRGKVDVAVPPKQK